VGCSGVPVCWDGGGTEGLQDRWEWVGRGWKKGRAWEDCWKMETEMRGGGRCPTRLLRLPDTGQAQGPLPIQCKLCWKR